MADYRRKSDIRALTVAVKRLNGYGISFLACYGKFLLSEPDFVGPTQKVKAEHQLTLEEKASMILRIHYAACAISPDSLVLLECAALNLRESETLCEDLEGTERPAPNVINLNQQDFKVAK